MAQWRQLNVSNQQQAATQAALTAQANFERQKWYSGTAGSGRADRASTAEGRGDDAALCHRPQHGRLLRHERHASAKRAAVAAHDRHAERRCNVQAMPGGGVRTVAPAWTRRPLPARAAAQAQGIGVGGVDVAKQLPVLAEQGRNAMPQAIGNIDYGMNQLNEAAKGGIPSGYFAPWLANVSAGAAKSLGFTGMHCPPSALTSAAVGNVQSARQEDPRRGLRGDPATGDRPG